MRNNLPAFLGKIGYTNPSHYSVNCPFQSILLPGDLYYVYNTCAKLNFIYSKIHYV